MIVEIHLLHQSQPILRIDVKNTYVKSDLFCLMMNNGKVEKYPVIHIFRIVEMLSSDISDK